MFLSSALIAAAVNFLSFSSGLQMSVGSLPGSEGKLAIV